MNESFEGGLLEPDTEKNLFRGIISNAGKIIAVITALVAILATFTDLSFAELGAKSFTASLLMMLISSYMIYFSLESAGEQLGEESEEFTAAKAKFLTAKERLTGEMVGELRDFLSEYSRDELIFRRKNLLFSLGESYLDFEKYMAGEKFPKKRERIFKKAKRLRPLAINVKTLLSGEMASTKSELENPETFKILRLILKLIPTTVCMFISVSVIPSLKDDLTFATVIEGIIKLSTLPIIGFRGYSAGYGYVKSTLTLWTETKARILEAFFKKREEKARELISGD